MALVYAAPSDEGQSDERTADARLLLLLAHELVGVVVDSAVANQSLAKVCVLI